MFHVETDWIIKHCPNNCTVLYFCIYVFLLTLNWISLCVLLLVCLFVVKVNLIFMSWPLGVEVFILFIDCSFLEYVLVLCYWSNTLEASQLMGKRKNMHISSPTLYKNTKKQPTVFAAGFFCFSVLMTQWLLGQLLRFQIFRKAFLHILCFGNDPLLTHKLFSAYIWNANTGHPSPSLVW